MRAKKVSGSNGLLVVRVYLQGVAAEGVGGWRRGLGSRQRLDAVRQGGGIGWAVDKFCRRLFEVVRCWTSSAADFIGERVRNGIFRPVDNICYIISNNNMGRVSPANLIRQARQDGSDNIEGDALCRSSGCHPDAVAVTMLDNLKGSLTDRQCVACPVDDSGGWDCSGKVASLESPDGPPNGGQRFD